MVEIIALLLAVATIGYMVHLARFDSNSEVSLKH
jgi:hypothetical protein